MLNALTFDVEEYFHAETFAQVVDRRDWPSLETRVVGATERILGILAEARTAATFFVLGWVAERHPAASARTTTITATTLIARVIGPLLCVESCTRRRGSR